MNIRITASYMICVQLLAGLAFLLTGCSQHIDQKPVAPPAKKTPSEITQHFHRMLNYHKRMDGNVPDGSAIFIGDSITQGLCVSAITCPAVNYGIGSDTTVGVLKRLPSYQSIKRSSAVVLAIGINDMRYRSNEDILNNYARLAEHIPNSIPVIFSAVLPIDEESRDEWKGRRNTRIKALNTKLEVFTQQHENLIFIDAGPLLIDEKGNLADKYHTGDGVHLNPKGNAIWIGQLRKAIDNARHSW